MKRFQEQFHTAANRIRLSTREKRELRERLSAYMAYHPLPEDIKLPSVSRQPSAFMAFLRSVSVRRTASALALVVLVAVPVYAERSLPGDVLYPIKVRVNEGVRSQLANSPYEQVEWETTRLERRLAEARVLADAGKLTPEVEADVANAVRAHSDAAQEGIESIRESDRDEAAIAELTLSSTLDVQSELFADRSAAISGVVNEARDTAAASSEVERPSYEKLLARVERESTTAYELLDSIRPDATETERAEITKRLGSISEQVDAAIALHKEGRTEEAIDGLAEALTSIRKVISFMTDIDVRTNVSINELVPDIADEPLEREVLESELADLRDLLARKESATTSSATTTLQSVTTLLAEVEDALSREALQEAQNALIEAAAVLEIGDGGQTDTTSQEADTESPATTTSETGNATSSRATTSAEDGARSGEAGDTSPDDSE